MGFRTLDEVIGRADLLSAPSLEHHWKARHLDLSPLLRKPDVPHGTPIRRVERQPDILADQLDWELLRVSKDALDHQKRVQRALPISNRNRTSGLSSATSSRPRYGEMGLREDTIDLSFEGSAGQSFGAFLTRGITLRVLGDANDYVGKDSRVES